MPAVAPRAATPRQIRRAFGANATAAIDSHASAIEALNKQVGFLTAVLARGFFGRLKWLLIGR